MLRLPVEMETPYSYIHRQCLTILHRCLDIDSVSILHVHMRREMETSNPFYICLSLICFAKISRSRFQSFFRSVDKQTTPIQSMSIQTEVLYLFDMFIQTDPSPPFYICMRIRSAFLVSMYTCIYKEREMGNPYLFYIPLSVCIYIYVYVYMQGERDRQGQRNPIYTTSLSI